MILNQLHVSNKLDIKLEELDEFHKMPKKYYENQKKYLIWVQKILNLFSLEEEEDHFER